MPNKIKSVAEFRFLMANKPDVGRELKGNQSLKGLPYHVGKDGKGPLAKMYGRKKGM